MRVENTSKRILVLAGAAAIAVLSAGGVVRAATIVAQGSGAFFGNPEFGTAGATEVAGYINPNDAQNSTGAGQTSAGLGKSVGEAFTISSPTDLTDFEINENGGPGTPAGGNVNFTVTYGTLSTSTQVFTPISTETATAVALSTSTSGGPANTFEDFVLSTPIPVTASPAGTEYGFVIGENATQDLADDITGGAVPPDATIGNLNPFDTTSQGYNGTNITAPGAETVDDGLGAPGTSLDFVVGGTTYTGAGGAAMPEPASLSLLAIGGLSLLGRHRRRNA